MFLSNTRKDIF